MKTIGTRNAFIASPLVQPGEELPPQCQLTTLNNKVPYQIPHETALAAIILMISSKNKQRYRNYSF